MGVYIKGMEMPTTGLYFVSVDNAGGRDKTVVTVERMLGNRDARQIVGSFELVPVPPHGRLGDLDELYASLKKWLIQNRHSMTEATRVWIRGVLEGIAAAPTIIPAEEEPNVPDP